MGCGVSKVSPNVVEPDGSASKAPTKQPPNEKSEPKTNGSDIQPATSTQPNQIETANETPPKETENPTPTEEKKEITTNISPDTKTDVKIEESRKPLTSSDVSDPGTLYCCF